MRRKHRMFVVAVIWMCCVSLVWADDPTDTERAEFDAPALNSTWLVRVGGSLSAYDTVLAWSAKGLGGAVIPVEDVLGLDESNETFKIGAEYRFNRRHSIELTATEFRRHAKSTIDSEIEWGDYIFRAHGEVGSELNIALLGLKYRYDFSDSGRLNAGFSAGLSTFGVEAMISGEARLENDQGEEWVEGVVEGADVIAPVPMIGIFLDYAMTPKLLVRFSAEIIDLDISGHSGRVMQTKMALEYCFTDSFGVGLDIDIMDLEYRTEESKEKLGVDYKVKSLGAYLSWVF